VKAVIIKGNPKKNPPNKGTLYPALQELLEEQGYEVEYDAGEEFTVPDVNADVWIGHSRGADRLRFAPEGVTTIAIGSNLPEAINHPNDETDIMPHQWHYLPSQARQAHHDWHPSMREKILERLEK
jgi:hypothetical protein